ncbi:MAG: hypothetical protein KJ886_03660 [Candidatus Thermoplasmatota archaeon]|nr:hypothetical protein [Candidatus Thermoplasmatota archaeon]
MEINWRDLIDKSLVVELHGELHEVKVIRISPNGTAVQFDFATGSGLSDIKWVRADQVTILDMLDEDL